MAKLYRKRYIPNEIVELKDDVITYQDEDVLVTKWNVLHPKAKFSHGVSCYYLKEGYKVSKFFNDKNELVYYYCDIIQAVYKAEEDAYIFHDLLADVIIYENGFVKVVDLAEIADALDQELITERKAKLALRRLDALLEKIYNGDLPELFRYLEAEDTK